MAVLSFVQIFEDFNIWKLIFIRSVFRADVDLEKLFLSWIKHEKETKIPASGQIWTMLFARNANRRIILKNVWFFHSYIMPKFSNN